MSLNALNNIEAVISLGRELSATKTVAFDLWKRLPSFKLAQTEHRECDSRFMPSVLDVISEAAELISQDCTALSEQHSDR